MIFNQVVVGFEPRVSPPKSGTLVTQPLDLPVYCWVWVTVIDSKEGEICAFGTDTLRPAELAIEEEATAGSRSF